MAHRKRTGAPRKLVCLETYWGDHRQKVFQRVSVLPFLEGLALQFDPLLRIAHRFVDSPEHLAAYTRRPDGLFWRDAESFDAPVYYLSFHGSPGTVHTALARLGPEALCEAFAGWGESYRNLVYFGACSVFAGRAGRQFARRFLEVSRCRALLGYTTDIDWVDSMVTDLLFLRRFYGHASPWRNLAAIHAAVRRDFAPARRLGFSLFT